MSKTISYIRDVTFNYACLTQQKLDRYGKLGLQIEFTKDRVQELSKYGNVIALENGNFGINLNTNPAFGKDSPKAGQPKIIPIIDLSKNPVTAIVGNGSKGDLKVFTYPAQRAHNGMKTAPMAMLVKELKEYVPTESNDFDILEKDTVVQATTNNSADF